MSKNSDFRDNIYLISRRFLSFLLVGGMAFSLVSCRLDDNRLRGYLGGSTPSTAPLLPPSNVERVSPLASPGIDPRPTIRASGVQSGDLVKLYSDSSCLNELGSALASGPNVDITSLSNLTPGVYQVYTKVVEPQESVCSTAFAEYELVACPEGYISVPADITLGTSDFCVMKYEAKAWEDTNSNGEVDPGEVDPSGCGDGGACSSPNWASIPTYLPISQADAVPWREISQDQARSACEALNEPGETNFALISNPEWMTVARNIESQDSNWSGSLIGNGLIFQGNNGSNTVSSYNGGGPEGGTGRDTKAMHVLSNGEEVWDFSGNLWNWVDWNVTPSQKAYYSGDGSPQSAFREFGLLDVLIGINDEMFPNSWSPNIGTSSNGAGYYYSGSNTTGGAARRGAHASTNEAGVFALSLHTNSSYTAWHVGFRCVYRP